jgi:predicted DNA-binding transcriptional regulator YafY
MKIERLIGIVFYLTNRKMVTANQLADYFDVSKRTILRDINVLTLAGIPIYAENGSKGGYSISPHYRVNEKIIDLSNTQYMLLALKSLKSVYGESKVNETYEKVKHIYDSEIEASHIEIDFSVIRENENVISKVTQLRTALINKHTITFEYMNQSSKTRQVRGNIIHVYYRWYAWYAFVHDLDKDRNLMFKIPRMAKVNLTGKVHIIEYDATKLIDEYNQVNDHQKMTLLLEYPLEYDLLVNEYFKGEIVDNHNASVRRKVSIQENDFMMFSLILGFGDRLKVIAPDTYRNKVTRHLEAALENNDSNGDI